MYPNPQRLIASAVFSGSWMSSGGGVREVFTEQNRQPRVHVSPISYKTVSDGRNAKPIPTIIVAVAFRFAASSPAELPPDPPPQHSPMLGHRASSHTVCKPSPRKSFLIFVKDAPVGMVVLRYDGSRGL
jgi:hypothetical protein